MRSFLYNGNEHYNKILLIISDHGTKHYKTPKNKLDQALKPILF